MYVYTLSLFTRYLKNTRAIISIFVGTVGTLGQHEFAFGFCGSVGVEISSMRSVVARDPSVLMEHSC